MSQESAALPGQSLGAYAEKLWGGPSRLVPQTLYTISTSPVRICTNNPRRMMLLVVNQSNSNVYFGFDGTVTTGTGILLAPLGGSLELTAFEDGEATGYECYCIAGAAGMNVSVWEVIRK